MFKVSGKYNEAKIFTENIEEEAIEQIKTLCSQDFVENSKIRIMPDVHSGAGCTIGTTMTITDKIVPNLVGVDIGCGMEVVKIKEKNINLEKLDEIIYEYIPSGFNIRDTEHEFTKKVPIDSLKCKGEINLARALRSIGTLGGGNHFIEVNVDTNSNLYIVVHSGSRHLGVQVAEYYQSQGYRQLNGNSKEQIADIIKKLKLEGREKEIESSIKEINTICKTHIPRALAYVEGQLFNDYLNDMKITQYYAEINRKAIIHEIIKNMNLNIEEQFTTIHNYIDLDKKILRKGAVSALRGEKLLIPINMRDGSLICIGKGNEDWNYSAPHGAGRIMSRTKAKKTFKLEDYKKSMEGIFTTSVREDTLDECPFVYKDINEIMENIKDTVKIVEHIKPIYNFKAGE